MLEPNAAQLCQEFVDSIEVSHAHGRRLPNPGELLQLLRKASELIDSATATMPKPYLLFTGDAGSRGGGVDDFKGSFDSIEEAMSSATDWWDSWAHIVERATMKILLDGDVRHNGKGETIVKWEVASSTEPQR
ncbi:MAG: hypothetical protein V4787_02210 [Pseudomonadota bacterium]